MPRIVPLHLGRMSNDARVMSRGSTGRISYPVPGYAVLHERGTVVFDTGLHPSLLHGTDGLGALAEIFTVELDPCDLIPGRLQEGGVDPESVTHVVNSHLHFDHCGQNAALSGARTIVQRAEWHAAHHPAPLSYLGVPLDELGAGEVQLVDGAHDVFGDGSVVCVPTPGHTAGHQSLLVSCPEASVLLVGDACYTRAMLDGDAFPPFAADAAEQSRTYVSLRRHAERGAALVFSHDESNWNAIPEALR